MFAAVIAVVPVPGSACSTAGTGARCIAVAPASTPIVAAALAADPATPLATPVLEAGEVLERGRHSILMNAEYYGLPPVSDGWVYMRVERDLYRVDWRSHQVIDRVTDLAAANF